MQTENQQTDLVKSLNLTADDRQNLLVDLDIARFLLVLRCDGCGDMKNVPFVAADDSADHLADLASKILESMNLTEEDLLHVAPVFNLQHPDLISGYVICGSYAPCELYKKVQQFPASNKSPDGDLGQ